MKRTFLNRAVTLTTLTGGAFTAVAAAMLFNPGPAFSAPRLLGTRVAPGLH